MMSPEEDLESVTMLDKLLKTKTKRSRQRVDAGEPRNSYSTVTNFNIGTSPSVHTYENEYNMSLTNRAYESLITHQNRECSDMVIDSVMPDVTPKNVYSQKMASEKQSQSKMCLKDGATSDAHMTSLFIQNVECLSAAPLSESSNSLQDSIKGRIPSNLSSSVLPISLEERTENRFTNLDKMSDPEQIPQQPSPAHSPVAFPSPDCSPVRPRVMSSSKATSDSKALEIKRARVENIVSTMLQGPSDLRQPGNPFRVPVNGCKKRKLYQPQQHEATRILNGDKELEREDNQTFIEPLPKQHRTARDLKSQLQKMKEQLVFIQQRYTELLHDRVKSFSTENTDAFSPSDHQEVNSETKPQVYPSSSTVKGRDEFPSLSVPLSANNCVGVYPELTENINLNTAKNIENDVHINEDIRRLDRGSQENNLKNQIQESRQSCIVKPNSYSSQTELTAELDILVGDLKYEISTKLAHIIDSIVTRYKQTMSFSKTMVSEPSKDMAFLTQVLDRKSPRTKVTDRGSRINNQLLGDHISNPFPCDSSPRPPAFYPLGMRPSTTLFCPTPSSQTVHLPSISISHNIPISHPQLSGILEGTEMTVRNNIMEQTEAISLVVMPKKKRHKVTDTRVIPRMMNWSVGQEDSIPKYSFITNTTQPSLGAPSCPNHPPPLIPISLPTSVAIPNPSLHHTEQYQFDNSKVAYFTQEHKDNDPFHHRLSTFFVGTLEVLVEWLIFLIQFHTSTLTPMHLRKAKLMFFYVRYPSSAVLKLYFPDIKFNKNNTAQLVKWFSNFREFYYIQMEKYSRQAISEGIESPGDLKVTNDSELIRTLNLHYNRNNHIEVPEHFRFVVEQTLKEFFKAIIAGKDQQQSWKKAIYKLIARLDDNVPAYFKTPNFLEQLE
ncbi:homeobox protein prospero-like [Tachypleus tridentatus]|uniref:homeobox protein prospero-like n=1 Tax=Tachypleus tridentatus TaxID=6853 RepID=UPI003FD69237